MSENTNTKHQNKGSVVILIAVIVVIIGVIGFGLYQNSDKSRNSTPDEISTSQVITAEEPTTQEITTVAPTTAEPTTEEPTTEKPTEKVTDAPSNPTVYDLYGYYSADGYYLKYTANEYESKNYNGFIMANETIISIDSTPLNDGGTRFVLNFANSGYDYVRNLTMDKDKNLYGMDGSLFKSISKEQYDSLGY